MCVPQSLEYVKAGHVRELQVQDHTVEWMIADRLQSFATCRGDRNLDVIMAQKLTDTELFGRVVFNNQQTLATRLRVVPNTPNGVCQLLRRSRLGYERECSSRQSMLAVLVQGQHLYRYVPRAGILLQVVQ